MIALVMRFFELTAFAAIFMLLCFSIGRFIVKPLRVGMDDPALLLCGGLTPLLVCLFYAQETDFAVPFIWLWFALSLMATISTLRNLKDSRVSDVLKHQIVRIITTIALVGLIYSYLVGRDGPASLANNDIYSWYSVASTLISKARYAEMSPWATEAWPVFAHDGYGTNWMLALVGFFYRDPINSSTLFLVITSSWLALIFQWQLRTLFSLGHRSALLLSIVPVASTFYLYIAFNSFYAQLLGTVGGALLISIAIRLHRDRNTPIFRATGLLLLPILWCLYVYQSGFLAFQFIGLGYAFFLFLLSEPYKDGLKSFLGKYLGFYSLALVVAGITNPQLALYLVNRTATVSNVVAGWPLPLLPLNVFMGIPWPDGATWLYSGEQGFQLLFYPCLVIVLIIISYVQCRQLSNENKNMILGIGIWYLILICIYLYWFYSGKSSYQSWKFSAFFVFSSSALPLGIVTLATKSLLGCQTTNPFFTPRYRRAFVAIIAMMIIVQVMYSNLSATKGRLVKLGPAIEQLVKIRGGIEQNTKVNILLGDYGHSMLPMLLLSPKASIYPLANTYIRPSAKTVVDTSAVNLISGECGRLLQFFFREAAETAEVMRTRDYAVYPSTESLGFVYRFNAPGERCNSEGSVTADFGFADPEPWGRWSAGSRAQLSFEIPPFLRGKELEIYMRVQPYIAGHYKEQRVIIVINGKRNVALSLLKPEMLTIKLDAATSATGQIEMQFEFPDAQKPSETDPSSTDQRNLAVGFIDLGIRATN